MGVTEVKGSSVLTAVPVVSVVTAVIDIVYVSVV